MYDQYAEWCEKQNLSYNHLPSFHRDCETANGTHGDKWRKDMRQYYGAGLTGTEIHEEAFDLFSKELPCQENGECTYLSNRQITNKSDVDVLIGHYKHAYVPHRVEGRYIVFDEFPENDFLEKFEVGAVTRAINNYLSRDDMLPFEHFEDLLENRYTGRRQLATKTLFELYNPTLSRDPKGIVEGRNARIHTEAAAMVYAVAMAEDLRNEWEYTRLSDGRTAVRSSRDSILYMLNPPALDGAKGVVALDGTPTVPKWELLLGSELEHQQVLTDRERRTYVSECLKLRVIQTTNHFKPYAARHGKGINEREGLVLIKAIKQREKQSPVLITTKTARERYEQLGVANFVTDTEHYGNLKGSNKFKDTSLGIVIGSAHYGDPYVEMWAALAGKSAKRVEGTRGKTLDYGDSVANDVLYGMRENEVLQAVMRFGRDGKQATVYVHTAALPEWVERAENLPAIHTWSKGMNKVLDAIRDLRQDTWTVEDIVEHEGVQVTDRQVRNHLNMLRDHGYLKCDDSVRPYLWSGKRLTEIGKEGHVIFDGE
ncbi:hypothetical protein [Natronococcus occultus]|nr:hypothetical protein [Natronococcus occultus]